MCHKKTILAPISLEISFAFTTKPLCHDNEMC